MAEAFVVALPRASSSVTLKAVVAELPAVALKPFETKSCVPTPGVMLKALVVTDGSPVLVAVKVYPVPVLLIEQLKVATPLAALTGLVVQLRAPPPGLVPMARVTGAADVVTTLPRASSTDTPVVKFVPAVEVAGGCVVTTSWAAAPGVMLKALLVRRRQACAGGREGVAGARLVDRAAERGDAAGGVDRGHGGTGQGSATRVVRDGQADRGGRRGDDVAQGVLDRHARGEVRAGDRVGRLRRDGELESSPRCDGLDLGVRASTRWPPR